MAGKKKKGEDEENSSDEEDNGQGEDEGGDEPSALAGYVGLGLIGSLIVGFDPLRDAFQGNGSFENAVLRFLACVAVCVVGASMLGRLIDASAPTVEELAEEEAALRAASDPDAMKTDDRDDASLGSVGRQETETSP